MEKLKEIADKLINLTVLEARELGRILKEEYGIMPSVQKQYLPHVPIYQAIPVIEQKEFDVILKSLGAASKLNTVKLIKDVTSLGLLESKNLVDSTPAKIKEKIPYEEAQEIKRLFTDIGVEIEVV